MNSNCTNDLPIVFLQGGYPLLKQVQWVKSTIIGILPIICLYVTLPGGNIPMVERHQELYGRGN